MPPFADVHPRLLRCYVTLAEELHLGRAATRLCSSPAALAGHIAQLEDVLDRRLFIGTGAVALTPSGLTLLASAREALSGAVDEAA